MKMAVETFFLFGFKALDDMATEIFPPSPSNPLLKVIEKYEAKQLSDEALMKILEDLILKFLEVGFQFEDLKFHFMKQLDPSFGHTIILEVESLLRVAVEFSKSDPLVKISAASLEDMKESPVISISSDLLKKYLAEGSDILRLITIGEISIDKFYELNEIIVRALLGFTSAYFLKKEFQERLKNELKAWINSI